MLLGESDVPLEVFGQFVASLPADVYIRRIKKVFAEIAGLVGLRTIVGGGRRGYPVATVG